MHAAKTAKLIILLKFRQCGLFKGAAFSPSITISLKVSPLQVQSLYHNLNPARPIISKNVPLTLIIHIVSKVSHSLKKNQKKEGCIPPTPPKKKKKRKKKKRKKSEITWKEKQ
jgi:hypothetical protein